MHTPFSASRTSGRPAHQKRLLIVEDECIVAFDLSVSLEDMGYAVVATAASADEALQAAERHRPDLVLLDINIAGDTDGIQTGRLLQSQHEVPLVYLTANIDAATLARALTTEPAGYLVKPYNEHTLRTTIEVAFRHHDAEQARRKLQELEKAQLEQKYQEVTSLARQFRREATRDPLTGLYNRRRLHHVIKREISFAQREGHAVGFIFLDLDRFKQLNDVFGHAAGDTVLRAVADLLRSRIRIYDVACRYGGEEIVIVVPGASASGAAILAEHLRASIEELSVACAGVQLPSFTASFGVSSFPDHGWDLESVLNAADVALYQAKAEGRNRVVTATTAGDSADAPAADAGGGAAAEHDHPRRWAGIAVDAAFAGESDSTDDMDA